MKEITGNLFTPEQHAIISAFHALYSGGHAQSLRDTGTPDIDAMPPWTTTYWLGKQVVKSPVDLWLYQEIIFETRPELIIETGTSGGGSAYFFATILDLLYSLNSQSQYNNYHQIFTVDVDSYPELWPKHPRIKYHQGSSLCQPIADRFKAAAHKTRTMVSLDSLHTYDHVKQELALYAPLVSPGYYLVVEDTGSPTDHTPRPPGTGNWCDRAVIEFLDSPLGAEFEIDYTKHRHLFTSNWNGWLRRKSA